MWILLLMVLSSTGKIVVYEQGLFEDINDCTSMRASMLADFSPETHQAACVRWDREWAIGFPYE